MLLPKRKATRPKTRRKASDPTGDNLESFLNELEKMVGKRAFQYDAWNWASGEYQSARIAALAKKWGITKKRLMKYLMSPQ
jgi:hypothetical protein